MGEFGLLHVGERWRTELGEGRREPTGREPVDSTRVRGRLAKEWTLSARREVLESFRHKCHEYSEAQTG